MYIQDSGPQQFKSHRYQSSKSSWHSINLPHTYNLDAYSKIDYYQGKGYYRKSFPSPDLPDNRRVFLKIDAASKAADLTLNGKPLGSHNGGYSSFTFDITPYIADDNCEVNLREMIRQHYNHPSIIIWGYMNEILLIAPGPDKPEWPACRERTVNLAQRLEKTLKEEDPHRTSAMAYNMTDLYNEIGLDLVDVSGWNLYHGWYVSELHGFNDWINDQHNRYPHRPVIISEWGAGSDRRLHSDESKAFDFSVEYQQKYIEHYLPFIEKTKFISGSSYWNFIDFNVAARQESMPRVNNKGLFYNDRTPKDVAYYFKAMWRNDTPVLHIASRDRSSRIGNDGDKHPQQQRFNHRQFQARKRKPLSVGNKNPKDVTLRLYTANQCPVDYYKKLTGLFFSFIILCSIKSFCIFAN